jgi:hypothetical protein
VKRLVIELWRGDVPLGTSFWEYTVVYGSLLNAAALLAFLALLTYDQAMLGLIVHSIPTPYNLLVFVAVWRAAGKYQGKRDLAAAARIAGAVILAISFAV